MKEYSPAETVARIALMANRRNVTKAALNEAVGVNKDTIHQSARSKSGLTARILYGVAEVLDCPVDYLLGRDGYMYDIQNNEVVFQRVQQKPALSTAESQLLSLFRQLPELEKYKLLGRLELIAEQNQPKEETV